MSLKVGTLLPSFDEATGWLEENPPQLRDVSPVIVYFWAISCPACKHNMPELQKLRDKYTPLGVQFVAVHMPRGEKDLDVEKVKAVAEELGITEPCAVDNAHALGDAFETGGVWPVYYLFDGNKRLKRRAPGQLGIKSISIALNNLFEEPTPQLAS